ncbi:putative phosphoglycerate mutase [Actinoalloteichus hoggarensis]|uniref:Phosphoserine phosphatase 1 n=1 Tax=Actinoalloteichus hoggarensis TaxID=1470176 RepID=A0A221W9P9_9PSEU|nr:bifunctional RNase H/acid phosphatase [Actinoalloteichus hoggarensis]ASO22249.1 Phosphoserine phosphatase 1 [Actinoalloteichus hoggarensis]MBB5923331.1 putative phosphoglycerate mutase [Actinoalloteichus hoggarensis]
MSGAEVVVEADGGSRGNPGPAGFGAVVKDRVGGEVLAERSGGLGVATNNVAEYQGLIEGLRAAAELGVSSVSVRMDSKLVVEQMSGRWKIRHPQLASLARQARDLAGVFSSVRYEWIPRASNAHADRLANRAMDEQASTPGRARAAAGRGDGATTSHVPTGVTQASSGAANTDGGASATRSRPSGWNGASGTPTRLLLVRHGQTRLSVQRRYSGRGDVDLTEFGASQAAAVARRLAGLDGLGATTPVITSPLARTRQTAAAIASALGTAEPVAHPGLIETDFGDWERLTFIEAAERDPEEHARWLRDPSVPPPGGESFDVVHRRVRRARDELISAHGGATVIVVSHVTPIKSLLRMALDVGPSVLYRLHLDLASLSIAEFYPDGNASVRLVNDISHLS